MYTNIDHNLAKEAIYFWLSTHPECLPRNIPKEFVLEALSIVLEFNTFTYNGRFYLQIRGLSMGTKSAPTLATLVMAYLEIKLYDIIGERYGRQIQEEFTQNWRRFLDDCFLSWNTEIDTPNNMVSILNNLHPSIKFEEYIDHTEVDYLDVTIRKKNGKIITDLFPTSSPGPFVILLEMDSDSRSDPGGHRKVLPFHWLTEEQKFSLIIMIMQP